MEIQDAAMSSRKIVNKFSLNKLYYISWTRHLHDNIIRSTYIDKQEYF